MRIIIVGKLTAAATDQNYENSFLFIQTININKL